MSRPTSPFVYTTLLCFICLAVGFVIGRGFPKGTEEKEGVDVGSPEVASSLESGQPVDKDPKSPSSEMSEETETIDFSLPLADLLLRAQAIEDKAKRQYYLRQLVSHWIESDPYYAAEAREKFLGGVTPRPGLQNMGMEVHLSHFVSRLSDNRIREAWKKGFAEHPSRSEIFGMFVAKDLALDIYSTDQLLENSRNWNPWEQHRYNDLILREWSRKEPNRAYAHYLSNPAQFGENAERTIFDNWADQDFDGLSAHVASIQDEAVRNRALDAMAKHKAFEGTDQALDWANSLPSAADQDLAHDAIYRETPRGIGAVLQSEDGFPKVVQPLVSNGLQPGDLLLSAQNGEVMTEFYGKDLRGAIDVLLGTPGTDVHLQLLRLDPNTGQYTQEELTITRQQLWIEEDKEP